MRKLTDNQHKVLHALTYKTSVYGLTRDQVRACIGSLVMNGYAQVTHAGYIDSLKRDVESAKNCYHVMEDIAKEAQQEVSRLEARVQELENQLSSMVPDVDNSVFTITTEELVEAIVEDFEEVSDLPTINSCDFHNSLIANGSNMTSDTLEEFATNEWYGYFTSTCNWAMSAVLNKKLGVDSETVVDRTIINKLIGTDTFKPYADSYISLVHSYFKTWYPEGFNYDVEVIDSLVSSLQCSDLSLRLTNPLTKLMQYYGITPTGSKQKDFKLCMSKAHPDKGGDIRIAQALNEIKHHFK